MASLWPVSGSAGRRSKNVSEELRKVVICRTFGLWSVWAQGRGCSPHWWGRRKTAGAREGRPFWLPVFRAAICASQSLLLRKRKGAAGPVGPTSGSESGPGALLSGPVVGLFGGGVAACRAPWVLPFGKPAPGLLWEGWLVGRGMTQADSVTWKMVYWKRQEVQDTRHNIRDTRHET